MRILQEADLELTLKLSGWNSALDFQHLSHLAKKIKLWLHVGDTFFNENGSGNFHIMLLCDMRYPFLNTEFQAKHVLVWYYVYFYEVSFRGVQTVAV